VGATPLAVAQLFATPGLPLEWLTQE